jgi:hypothetical protein
MMLSLTQLSTNAAVNAIRHGDLSLKTVDQLDEIDCFSASKIHTALLKRDQIGWSARMQAIHMDINSRRWKGIYMEETSAYGDYFRDIVIVWGEDDSENWDEDHEDLQRIDETVHPEWQEYYDWMERNDMLDDEEDYDDISMPFD